MAQDTEIIEDSNQTRSKELSVDETSILEGSQSSDELESETSDFDDTSSEDSYENNNESLCSTIIREIENGTYMCLVCTGEIDKYSKVWSCDNCYRVYDLDCIKDWAIRGSSTDKINKKWRCPACNFESNRIPKKFTCWCGDMVNPPHDSLVPLSCGNPCNYKYENCIHNCSLECHPGNHPICGAMGPIMKCHCGKDEKQLPCLITPYKNGWSCELTCGIVKCEYGHECTKECHLGFCGLCEEIIKVNCYCGKEEIEIKCHEKFPKVCQKDNKQFIGVSKCDSRTKIYYDCNVHFDEVECQPIPSEVMVCKLSPSIIETCYCGKTKVDSTSRTKCTDPIPECDKVCGKPLPCGCKCLMKCHSGECECYNTIEVQCSCEHYTFMVPCKFVRQGYKPKCKHKCSALLNCRKHYHKEICCPYEQAAYRRERLKKKAIRNNVRTNFEDELMIIEPVHICTEECNRLKSCGKHYCEALCHSGPCGVCLESTNEDLVCHCGKTVIHAPVRCGTELVCHEQCMRDKDCGHRREIHECHGDDKPCPKCTKLVSKPCNCGKNPSIPNVLCSQTNVSCGNACKVNKNCGHPCMRVCSSDCSKENVHASSSLCQSICKKERVTCPHYCKLKCHVNKPGKSSKCDANVCSEPIWISCGCGTIRNKVPCGSSLTTKSRIGDVLDCNEICTRAHREASLKKAFELDAEMDTVYPDIVLTVYQRQTTWCSRIESTINSFVSKSLTEDNKGKIQAYHFPPMSKPQRTFVHELASSYKLYSESQDREPNRSVCIVITDATFIPSVSVSKALLMKQQLIMEKEQQTRKKQQEQQQAYFNSLIIQDVFFGVIKEDLERELDTLIKEAGISDPVIQWMKESTFVFFSKSQYQSMTKEDEKLLFTLLSSFRDTLKEKSLAFTCKLCLVDSEANYVIRTGDELDEKLVSGGDSNEDINKADSNEDIKKADFNEDIERAESTKDIADPEYVSDSPMVQQDQFGQLNSDENTSIETSTPNED